MSDDGCNARHDIDNGWLVLVVHDHCTCGVGPYSPYGHERGCGLVPLLDLRGLDGWADTVTAIKEGRL